MLGYLVKYETKSVCCVIFSKGGAMSLCRCLFLVSSILILAGNSSALSSEKVSFIKAQLDRMSWGQYFSTNCNSISVANWRGFPTEKCRYTSPSGFGNLEVILLNANNTKTAKWIWTACADASAKYPLHCAERLAAQIKCQSGNQFPISGFVEEWRKLFIFRDGVTVRIGEIGSLTVKEKPTKKMQELALGAGTVTEVKKYARVQGTTRGQYASFKKTDTSQLLGLNWQKTIRKAYQRAWNRSRNDLMSAWAVANRYSIDHKGKITARLWGCENILRNWAPWPIKGE